MSTGTKSGSLDVIVEELAAARASLVERRAANLGRLLDAKSALHVATTARLAPESLCFVDAEGSPLTVAQMESYLARLEAEDAKSFEVLGAIDEQLALALKPAPDQMQ